ncbi:uncharacterized protein LOC119571448 [Penaeus monodon]|uniref:uncharacterized protein LOC119571448 n=1 Tax=Penaeus monodon TaxID=6687 RepID=UPI0018A766EE|nr:uncharacterized protein LOC119571448 [Penaeus monodon]
MAFLVGGVICLVNSDNERDSSLLNSRRVSRPAFASGVGSGSPKPGRRAASAVGWLAPPARAPRRRKLASASYRSVMPLDVLGRTRATMESSATVPAPRGAGNLVKAVLKGDWGLQMFPMNEEFPVGAIHQIAPI